MKLSVLKKCGAVQVFKDGRKPFAQSRKGRRRSARDVEAQRRQAAQQDFAAFMAMRAFSSRL